MTTPMRYVGARIPQVEGPEKVTGRAIFAGDLALEAQLHSAVLRSPHAHARIVSIDASAAERLPGVHAVASATDCPRAYLNFGPAFADRYPFALGKVRFVGEEVLAVAAETQAIALEALSLVKVVYEPLPVAHDPHYALKPDAPEIHQRDGLARNIAQHTRAEFGDVQGGFARAALVVDGVYTHGLTAPVCLETNSVVARFDRETGDLTVWAPTQAPFFARKELAHVLALPLAKVHLRAVSIGGGFGGKSQAPETVAIAAVLAMKAGRPVRLVLSRREEFLAGKTDHGKWMHVRTAVDSEGNLLARHTAYLVDNGAYTHMGPAYVSAVRQRTCNLYRVAAAGFDGRLVYTNKVPGGSYRGMGAPQIIWALETQIDQIAAKLGKDRLEYRIQIANRPGDTTPQGWQLSTCALRECLQEVGRRIGWAQRRGQRQPWRGIGFASMINPSVGVLYPEGNFANVAIDLEPDGRLLVATQTADAGTSQNTVLAQFVAEELQHPIEAIHVLHMDTDQAPDDLGSAASRVTFMTGAAAIDAARRLRDALRQAYASRHGCAAEVVEVREGRIAAPGQPTETFAEFASAHGTMRVVGHHQLDLPRADPKTGFGNYAPAYGFGAQAVEVEVDPATGHVKVLQVIVVQDMGRVINPLTLEGQMHGGILQGIGMALREELVFDHGEPVNASLISYRVPRAMETPRIETHFIETLEPSGPLGAKAGGEHSVNPTIAAVANAVADAVGVHFTELPITPAKVLAAITAKQGREVPTQPWMRPLNAEIAAVRALYPRGLFPAMKALGRVAGRVRSRADRWEYLRPTTLDQAQQALGQDGRRVKVMAGGTDLQVGLRQGVYQADLVVDITGIEALRGIEIGPDHVRIGACTTLAQVVEDDALAEVDPVLREGLIQVATPQIRNMATLGGDLCQEKRCWFFRSGRPCYKNGGASCPCYAVTGDSRSHSILGARRCAAPCVADAAPILTAAGATAVVVGPRGQRRLAMERFYRWSGEPALRPDEIVAALEIPRPDLRRASRVFEKYAQWSGDFAEASVAVHLERDGPLVRAARIALGGVAPLPARARAAERRLIGSRATDADLRDAARACVQGALPLRDNAHKVPLLVNLAERALHRALAEHPGASA